jgi:Subtilisin inhibitor-like
MKTLIISALCAAALTAGCDSTGSSATSTQSPIRLTVTVAPGFIANAHVVTYHLNCTPPSGSLPDASAACDALRADSGLLAPIACRMTPDTGSELVKGTANGSGVNLRLSAASACSKRWRALSAALGISARG